MGEPTYNGVDRPSTRRIALTFVGIVAVIVLVVGISSFVLGTLGKTPALAPGVTSRSPVQSTTASAPAAASSAGEQAVVQTAPVETPAVQKASKAGSTTKSATTPKPPMPATPVTPIVTSGVVVIDAGHQAHADTSLEPIGPGASQKKPKVAGGATGVLDPHVPESQVNLDVALKLEKALQARGVKVIMVRTREDVNISNSERAAVANDAHAALFIRLHCDGSANTSLAGLSTLVPAANRWTTPIVAESLKAGRLIHRAVLVSTGATDRRVVNRADLAGFNWSRVPTVLVEMGFMSNPAEDRLLDTSSYQQKLADGLASGAVQYLRSR